MVNFAGLPTYLSPVPSGIGPTPKAHPHLSDFPHVSLGSSLRAFLSPVLGSLRPSSDLSCSSPTWTGCLLPLRLAAPRLGWDHFLLGYTFTQVTASPAVLIPALF